MQTPLIHNVSMTIQLSTRRKTDHLSNLWLAEGRRAREGTANPDVPTRLRVASVQHQCTPRLGFNLTAAQPVQQHRSLRSVHPTTLAKNKDASSGVHIVPPNPHPRNVEFGAPPKAPKDEPRPRPNHIQTRPHQRSRRPVGRGVGWGGGGTVPKLTA